MSADCSKSGIVVTPGFPLPEPQQSRPDRQVSWAARALLTHKHALPSLLQNSKNTLRPFDKLSAQGERYLD